MLQENKDQKASVIVCIFGFGCMHVFQEFGKKAASVLLACKNQKKAKSFLFHTLGFLKN